MSNDSLSNGVGSFAAVVIARMTSSRLPGKTLADVHGRPLIRYLIETLEKVRPKLEIVIATSTENSDDPISQYAKSCSLGLVRGDLHDVAGRLNLALQQTGCEAGFRVNGDSPLVQKDLFEKAIEVYENDKCDLVTNIWPRTYPAGISIELINAASYKKAYSQISDPDDKEHVTRFFYQNAEQFSISNIASATDYSNFDFAIDQPEDLDKFRLAVGMMDKHHSLYSVQELIDLFAKSHES